MKTESPDVTQALQTCLYNDETESLGLSGDEEVNLAKLLLAGTAPEVDLSQDSLLIMRQVHDILWKDGYDVVLRKQLKGCMMYPHINIRGMFSTAIGIREKIPGQREFVIADKCSDDRVWKAVPLGSMNGHLVRTVIRIAALQAAHAAQVSNPHD